jgi:hypothetical protein
LIAVFQEYHALEPKKVAAYPGTDIITERSDLAADP